MQSNKVI